MLTSLLLAVGLTTCCNLIFPMWESRNNNTVMWNIGPICYTVAIIIQPFGMNWGKIEKSESLFCLAPPPFKTPPLDKKKIIMADRSLRLRRIPCLVPLPAATILKFLIILNKIPYFHFAEDSANSVTSPACQACMVSSLLLLPQQTVPSYS